MTKKKGKAQREPQKPPAEIFLPSEPPNLALQKAEWKKAALHELPEGITLVPRGRSANIYNRRGRRVVDIYAELAGSAAYDVVVYTETIYEIDVETLGFRQLAGDDKERAVKDLRSWFDARGTRYSI